jgi:hypothetical protein
MEVEVKEDGTCGSKLRIVLGRSVKTSLLCNPPFFHILFSSPASLNIIYRL